MNGRLTIPCLVTGALVPVACSSGGDAVVITAGPVTIDAVSAGPTSPSTSTTTITAGADATQVAMVLSLLNVSTVEEWATALATNVPEHETAECMEAAGFEYVEGLSPDDEARRDPRRTMPADEYAARYGLGVTGWELGLFPPISDPNDEHVQSLTPAQQQAYQATLGTCRGMWDTERRAWSDALNVAVSQYHEALDADQRVVAALAAWRACLAAAGYVFESPQAMTASFYARMPVDIGREELEDLHADEVRVAVANVACEAAYRDEFRAVALERFDEYLALFDAARASGAAPEAQG